MRNDTTPSTLDDTLVVNTVAADLTSVTTRVLEVETEGLKSRQDEIRERLLSQQPIYRASGQVAGHELTLRLKLAYSDGQPRAALLRHADDETLLAGAFSLAEEGRLAGRTLFVSVSAETLMSPDIEYLPQQNIVLAVHAGADDVPTLLPRVKRLTGSGYRIVLDNVPCDEALRPLVMLASYLRVDVGNFDAIRLEETARGLRAIGARLLVAANVGEQDMFNICHRLGFDLFQGAHFSQPKSMAVGNPEISRLRVLELIDRVMAQADMAEVESLLKPDAILCYRLLRFMNAAGCGPNREVTSIGQALHSMGHERLYRWLTLLLHASGRSDAATQTRLRRALSRAHFLHAMGRKSLQPANADELYLVGLFSVMDEVLDMPMANAVAQLNLSAAVKQALVQRSGPLAGFLELALACEAEDKNRIEAGSAQCLVAYIDLNIALINALIVAEQTAL